MNGRTFSPNPRKRGKSHRHQIWSASHLCLGLTLPDWNHVTTKPFKAKLPWFPYQYCLCLITCCLLFGCIFVETPLAACHWQPVFHSFDSSDDEYVTAPSFTMYKGVELDRKHSHTFFFSAQTLTHSISVISFSSRMLARYRVHDTLWQCKEREREVSYFHVKKLSFLDCILFPEGLV